MTILESLILSSDTWVNRQTEDMRKTLTNLLKLVISVHTILCITFLLVFDGRSFKSSRLYDGIR